MTQWFYVPVNPEPWAIGPLQLGRRNGKMFPMIGPNPQLVSFKEGVREELANEEPLDRGEYELGFWFWRKIESYTSNAGRKVRKHQADATNLIKATEDALQGVLFENDRDVRRVTGVIVEQTPETVPGVIIGVQMWSGWSSGEVPLDVFRLRRERQEVIRDNNQWPPPGGF